MARKNGLRKLLAGPFLVVPLLFVQSGIAAAQAGLDRQFDLGRERSKEAHYYRMTTDVFQVRTDGTRSQPTSYRLLLEWIPAALSGRESDLMICHRLTIQVPGKPEVSVPSLDNWQYELNRSGSEKGQIFGIDQSRFTGLRDSAGNALPMDVAYAAFNVFVDFHSFTSVFAEPTRTGAGIQDLKRIGQRIVHESAYSEPPVSLTGIAATGSMFKNGEITLEFTGLSLKDNRPCALIHYDSGASSFRMAVQTGSMNVKGASHYLGDLYLDLESHWLTKANMIEFVLVEVEMSPSTKIRQVIERQLVLESVSKAALE